MQILRIYLFVYVKILRIALFAGVEISRIDLFVGVKRLRFDLFACVNILRLDIFAGAQILRIHLFCRRRNIENASSPLRDDICVCLIRHPPVHVFSQTPETRYLQNALKLPDPPLHTSSLTPLGAHVCGTPSIFAQTICLFG